MKLLLGLCLVICFVGAHCEDIATMIKNAESPSPAMAECMAESKVDAKTLAEFEKNGVIPNTHEMQCHLACMMKKDGMMNADGTLSQRFMEDERTKDCSNEGGKDTCEVAYKALDCYSKSELKKKSQK